MLIVSEDSGRDTAMEMNSIPEPTALAALVVILPLIRSIRGVLHFVHENDKETVKSTKEIEAHTEKRIAELDKMHDTISKELKACFAATGGIGTGLEHVKKLQQQRDNHLRDLLARLTELVQLVDRRVSGYSSMVATLRNIVSRVNQELSRIGLGGALTCDNGTLIRVYRLLMQFFLFFSFLFFSFLFFPFLFFSFFFSFH